MKKFLIFFTFLSLIFANTNALSNTITIGVENETSRINPLFDEDHDSALDLVFSGLVRFDEDMRHAPDLAESWQVSNDGLSYIFNLRKDVQWQDGIPFNAQDVQFSIAQAMDKKLNAPARANFTEVENIKIIDDFTVEIKLKKPFPPLLDALSIGILPKHLLANKDLSNDGFNQKPIGTGPYKLTKWKKGEYMRFEAHEHYHLGRPKTKNIILKILPNADIRAIELVNGQIDAALVDSSETPKLAKNKNLIIKKMPSADYRALMFNMNKDIFKDKNVRKAISYALNRDLIVKNILHDYGFAAFNPIQNTFAHDEKIPTYHYNIEKAKRILFDAGYKAGSDGILSKDGKKLAFEIYSFNSDPLRVSLANIMQSELQKIGIKATAQAKKSGSFQIAEVDSFVIGWGSPYDPDFHTFRIFSSTQDVDQNPNGWNYSHYRDQKVDVALSQARSSHDVDYRKAQYRDFLQAIYENPPFVFIAYLEFPLVHKTNIQGIKPHVLGHHGAGFLWNIFEWQQK